jgi:nitrite reductase/ring-hydroxylating ferredoxin subunit
MFMDAPNKEFVRAGSLQELKAKGRLLVHGHHGPTLVIYDRGRVFALDNRCPHMGFPLERGSIEDGILTCHWHHARFDLESGCTFDLWADDVPICPVEVRNGDVWVEITFGLADDAAHWHRQLATGLAHDLGLVIAKAVCGLLAADVPRGEIVRLVALFGERMKSISPCFTARAEWRRTAMVKRRGGSALRWQAGRTQRRSSAGCVFGQTCAIERPRSAPCLRQLRLA